MAQELFLEIGTEEIPAGFLPPAQDDLQRLLTEELTQARIAYGAVQVAATPRRLAISVGDVAEQQDQQHIEATGPAVKVAYDADGNPTKAAAGFARSYGVEVAELQHKTTPKGDYLYLSRTEPGRPSVDVLPELLQRVLTRIPFKKSMRWRDYELRFARPIHWLVALYGGEVLPVNLGPLHSGSQSWGHRFMAPQSFTVSGWQDYVQKTRQHCVLVDPQERRQCIQKQLQTAAREAGLCICPDEALLEEVTYLVEWPYALCGSFAQEYLQLPRELLISTMREHQRYFSLENAEGQLAASFLTVADIEPKDPQLVVAGNERVLRARLADAWFFWQEDQKRPLESRLEDLQKVVYQAKLGTSYEKIERFRKLANSLASELVPAEQVRVDRAALLCKCDLETAMVYEFPELQGIMGREYARLEGEDERVATAIYEHYLPAHGGGDLPADDVGALVAIADKLDTLCGCFGVGLKPTGTADPYALRRSALGLLRIVLERGYRISLSAYIRQALATLRDRLTSPQAEVETEVFNFCRQRLQHLWAQEYPQDLVEAVLAAGCDEVVDAWERLQALAAMSQSQEFAALAGGFKRVMNILVKEAPGELQVQPQLLQAPQEQQLHEATEQVAAAVAAARGSGDYPQALAQLAHLRQPVDAFFDNVMVKAPEEELKNNRLALLQAVSGLFEGIADFRKLGA